MYVKALKPYTEYKSNGTFFSPACGTIFSVTSEKGASLISDGLVEEYSLITPTGTLNVTENGSYNVTQYATTTVAVPRPSGDVKLTKNGSGFDIAEYATATVNVPNPSTGSLEITSNDTYDVTNYAQVVVNVGGK